MSAKKSWTFESALQAQDRFEARGGNVRGPLFEWGALQELVALEVRYKAGEKMALMIALRKCANFGLPMPAWVATAYIRAFDNVNSFRAGSWDDVFGDPLPKSAQLAALRKKTKLGGQLFKELIKIRREQGKPINSRLIVSVGETLGLGRTLALEYFADKRRRHRRLFGDLIPTKKK